MTGLVAGTTKLEKTVLRLRLSLWSKKTSDLNAGYRNKLSKRYLKLILSYLSLFVIQDQDPES